MAAGRRPALLNRRRRSRSCETGFMTELHAPRQRPFGAVIEAAADVEPLIAGLLDDGTKSVELVAGAGHLAGLHLGTVPRHGIRDAFGAAGITVESIASPIELNVERPDEGVVADVDAFIHLAADLGARRLKLSAGSVPSETEHQEPGITPRAERISQRLAAVLKRAGERDVQLVVENSGQISGAGELASVLAAATMISAGHDRPSDAGTDAEPVAGAVWNVQRSVSAGESMTTSAELLKPYLEEGRGYILCESAAAATALVEAVPDAAQWPVVIEGADEPAGANEPAGADS